MEKQKVEKKSKYQTSKSGAQHILIFLFYNNIRNFRKSGDYGFPKLLNFISPVI